MRPTSCSTMAQGRRCRTRMLTRFLKRPVDRRTSFPARSLERMAQFAKMLEGWRDTGRREARFLIGAADGHDETERAGADLLLSFGPATWPHLMVRAMLAEQLFRATSILANHPYHREG